MKTFHLIFFSNFNQSKYVLISLNTIKYLFFVNLRLFPQNETCVSLTHSVMFRKETCQSVFRILKQNFVNERKHLQYYFIKAKTITETRGFHKFPCQKTVLEQIRLKPKQNIDDLPIFGRKRPKNAFK